jgi:hypothetical protein
LDHLEWRGDLSFGNAPLCPADTLLLSALSYERMDVVLSPDPKAEPERLGALAERMQSAGVAAKNEELWKAAVQSARFGSLRLFAAQSELDAEKGVQFSAYAALLPGQMLYVCFRGTDDTLIGWREDLRMSYECPVPAQLRAVEYLRAVAAAYPLRRIYVGGHSKGGNLAMYAAVNVGPGVRERIRRVFNHDGPGFCDDTMATPAYREMRDKIDTYVPESSIVGVLLEHDEEYRIVKSDARGILQHDPYSWRVRGAEFEYTAERTAFGKETEQIIDRFVSGMSPDRKRLLGEALFAVLESTHQDTVSGIGGNLLQSARHILRSYTELDPELRAVLNESITALNRTRRRVRRESKESS